MERSTALTLIAGGVIGLSAPLAVAQDDAPADVQSMLEAMQTEMDALRDENRSMRNEVDQLRAELDDDWMSQERADEIRIIVEDVLADADQRVGYMNGGLAAGWDDHFFMASPDGRFKLVVDGMLQVRHLSNYRDEPDNWLRGFENTRTKLTFRGHVFSPNVEYLIRGNFGGESAGGTDGLGISMGGEFDLQDAWIRWHFDSDWSVRGGQFKPPQGREELVSPAYQLAVERSLVNESHNLGRSQGIELQYQGDDARWTFAYDDGIDDQLGGFGTLGGTTPENTPAYTRTTEYAFQTRYEKLITGTWEQFRDFTSPAGDPYGVLFGIAGHIQDGEYGTAGSFSQPDNETFRAGWTADLSIEWGGANMFASFVHTYVDHPSFGIFNVFGAVVQGGFYVDPKWEVFGRFEWDHWDANNFNPVDLWFVTVGTNYYIDGHDLKWTTDIGLGLDEIDSSEDSAIAGVRQDAGGDKNQVVFRTQIQLLF